MIPGYSLVTAPLLGIAAMIGGTALMQLKTPTTISRYFYMNTNCQHDFSDSNGVISKRQMIDEYERSLDDKRIYFKSKLYSPFQNNTIGIYYNERTLKLTLVKL